MNIIPQDGESGSRCSVADTATVPQTKFATLERARHAATLAALPPRRFRTALEIGCGGGTLTRLIARRCDGTHGIDADAAMIARAENKCADLSNVRFSRMAVPAEWPLGLYDLVVISGAPQGLAPDELRELAVRVTHCLSPSGFAVLSLLIGEHPHFAAGEDAAALFLEAAAPALSTDFKWQETGVRINRLRRTPLPPPTPT